MAPEDLENPDTEMMPLDDEELATILRKEAEDSIGVDNSEIADQRAYNMDRYLGEPYGNEVEGRSQVISRDVTDAVEWAMPQIMDVFFSGDRVAEIDPEGPEDLKQTELETAYMNYVFLRKNRGFLETYQAIKDCLIQKDGILKVWVEDQVSYESFDVYEGLLETELLVLLQDPEVELVEKTERIDIVDIETGDPQTPFQAVETPVYDVKIRKFKLEPCERVAAVPPEELKVSKRTRLCLQDSPYVAHCSEYTLGELTELVYSLGLDVDPEIVFASGHDTHLGSSPEKLSRHTFDGTNPEGALNFDTDTCQVWEEYLVIDANKDGFEERIKVIRVGDTILTREEHELVPFAHFVAIPLSHKFNGLGLADLVKDIALLKTSLHRNIFDNIYRQNNGRTAVLADQVEMDDLLTDRPGGVVREFISGAVRPLQEPALGQQVYNLLGYLDQVRDERTGISKLSQGLDPNALSSNVSTGSISQLMSAAQQRIKLMARILAEGMRETFWLLHETSRRHVGVVQRINFNNQWQEIVPMGMMKRKDFSIRVGLGNIERDADLARLGMLAQDMQMIAANGGAGRLLQEQNIYALAVDRAKAAGVINPERYYTNPELLEPPQPQPSGEEIKAQVEQFKEEVKAQTALEVERIRAESQERIEALKAELKTRELDIKEEEMLKEYELEKAQGRGIEIG